MNICKFLHICSGKSFDLNKCEVGKSKTMTDFALHIFDCMYSHSFNRRFLLYFSVQDSTRWLAINCVLLSSAYDGHQSPTTEVRSYWLQLACLVLRLDFRYGIKYGVPLKSDFSNMKVCLSYVSPTLTYFNSSPRLSIERLFLLREGIPIA